MIVLMSLSNLAGKSADVDDYVDGFKQPCQKRNNVVDDVVHGFKQSCNKICLVMLIMMALSNPAAKKRKEDGVDSFKQSGKKQKAAVSNSLTEEHHNIC